ncbi:MAG: HEAT repeat domain-containing protein [Anaerolineales bacterium]
MFQFPPRIYLDFASFWIGVLTASLAWFLFQKIRPHGDKVYRWVKNQILIIREKLTSNTENTLRQKTLEYAQNQHLSSAFCALEEIIIPPRFLAPPYQLSSLGTFPDINSIQQAIPYTPDTPEFASEYQSPTLSLPEALSQNVNIAILGKPGSGRTVALADLASRLAKREIDFLSNMIPLFLDINDLLPYIPAEDIIQAVYNGLTANPRFPKMGTLENVIQNLFDDQRAFLLIDSVDQLPRQELVLAMNFISSIIESYPWCRVVTTSSTEYYDGLLETDLYPIAITSWSAKQRALFAKHWGETWSKYHPSPSQNQQGPGQSGAGIDTLLINSWLFHENNNPTPLEFTLKVWSVYAGDVLGPHAGHAIDAYLRRCTTNLPEMDLPDLQKIAISAIMEGVNSFGRDSINRWLRLSQEQMDNESSKTKNPLRDMLNTCLEQGILAKGSHQRYRFNHPSIAGYIAAKAAPNLDISQIKDKLQTPQWSLSTEAFRFSGAAIDMAPLLSDYIDDAVEADLLQKDLLQFGRLLPFLPTQTKIKDHLLKLITKEIASQPVLETKLRLAVILSGSGDANARSIFRYLLSSRDTDVRHVAVLGSGFLRDTQAVETIIGLLGDSQTVGQAACIALVNIGTPKALEAVAETLLTGDDTLRRAAAEALANHPRDGYPTLKDASEMDQLSVKYASVYGLKRIHENWALDILDEMRIEEDEWVVRDAAQQAYETLHGSSPFIPTPPPPISEVPLFHSFAAEKEIEITSIQVFYNLLVDILSQGNVEQKLAALYYIQMKGFGSVFPEIYQTIFGDNREVQRSAANTLWHLSLTGMDLPSPKKFGIL